MIHSITRRRDFSAFSRSNRGRSATVRARFLPPMPSEDGIWVGFALPKQLGNAVERNRIRRRLRAALHDLERDHDGPPSGRYLLGASREAALSPYLELRADLRAAMRRAAGVRT